MAGFLFKPKDEFKYRLFLRNLPVSITHEALEQQLATMGIKAIRIKVGAAKNENQRYTSAWISCQCYGELKHLMGVWHNSLCLVCSYKCLFYMLAHSTSVTQVLPKCYSQSS